jgi:hypothetical protein
VTQREKIEHLTARREQLVSILGRLKAIRAELLAFESSDYNEAILASNQNSINTMERLLVGVNAEFERLMRPRTPEKKNLPSELGQ